VAIDLVGDAIEVEHAAAHAQIAPPVVRIALVGDIAAEVHAADPVRTAGDGNVHYDLVEGFSRSPVPAENSEPTDEKRQLSAGPRKFELYCARAEDDGALHVAVHDPELRVGLLGHQDVEAVLDVGRHDGLAVV